MSGRALVLAGGGVAGIAWQTGFLYGAFRAGVNLLDASIVVGTSAGATVGAQITSGVGLADLAAAQMRAQVGEIPVPGYDTTKRRAMLDDLRRGAPNEQEALRRIGQMALAAETVAESLRRAVIAARLPVHDWPKQALKLVAVDCDSGEWVVFDRESGVSLIDAVAASCAVPGVWPPVTIKGRRYTDGGVRSTTNADVAKGCEKAVVIVPLPLEGLRAEHFEAEVKTLGVAPFVVEADAASRDAIGSNPLDPDTRGPACDAGARQGEAMARKLEDYWAA